MTFKTKAILAAVATLTLFSANLPTTQAASPAPLGFQLMCLKTPSLCRGGGPASIALTEPLLLKIREVNARLNRSITPRNDPAGDDWTVGSTAGDCEDYVMGKRQALLAYGLPSSALRIAYVQTRSGIDHAILVIKTDGADLVLDNLVADVLPLSSTVYRVLAMSGADPMNWTRG